MGYFVTLLREAHKLEVPFVLEQKFRLVGFLWGPIQSPLGAFGWFYGAEAASHLHCYEP